MVSKLHRLTRIHRKVYINTGALHTVYLYILYVYIFRSTRTYVFTTASVGGRYKSFFLLSALVRLNIYMYIILYIYVHNIYLLQLLLFLSHRTLYTYNRQNRHAPRSLVVRLTHKSDHTVTDKFWPKEKDHVLTHTHTHTHIIKVGSRRVSTYIIYIYICIMYTSRKPSSNWKKG